MSGFVQRNWPEAGGLLNLPASSRSLARSIHLESGHIRLPGHRGKIFSHLSGQCRLQHCSHWPGLGISG
jgi:hypothetical protein